MKKLLILLILYATVMSQVFANEEANKRWLIYYSAQGKPTDFQYYNPLVFSSDHHPDLKPLKKTKSTLGYISLGEVMVTRDYFDDVSKAGILIAPNPSCPGSWYVDIRNPHWKKLILKVVIPKILKQEFKGLFLDNLDIPTYLEHVNPAAYIGMTQAVIDLVHAIRKHYPDIPLMANRAYQILNQIGGAVDYALGESLLTEYNPETERYQYVSLAKYQMQVERMQKAKLTHPNLTLFSLDYWDSNDTCTMKSIYQLERQNGFKPYVSDVHLQQIVPEPYCCAELLQTESKQ